MITSKTTSPDEHLRRRAEETGGQLKFAVEALLADLAERGARDQRSLQEAFGLSQSAISRVISAVRHGDSLATLSAIPGLEALRQMVKGASKWGADKDCVARADEAVGQLETFLESEIGDRGALEAVLSDWVRESRATFELRHKQAAFKAMSAVRGVKADLVLNGGIVYPSAAHPGRYDCIGIDVLLGCRRVRPSGVLRLYGSDLGPHGRAGRITNLDGGIINAMPDMLLPAFSTIREGHIATTFYDKFLDTTIVDLPLGRGTERGEDLVCCQVYRGLHRAQRGDGPPSSGIGGQSEPPSEWYVVDALLHEDVWPGIRPDVRVFDTVVRGITHPDSESRQGDRLDLMESVQELGRGPQAFRLPEFPRYPELIKTACNSLGWDSSKLRGFRCKIRYPIHGSQIGLAFQLSAESS